MATSFQTPDSGQIRVLPLHEAPQAQVFVDSSGDTWVGTGRTSSGELLLACPQPLDPEDRGDGDGFAWTFRLVEAGFGPLKAVSV
jgi:hypothetical protein